MPTVRSRFSLTGNQLKLLAMLTMTIDHIGAVLLPQYEFLRIIGRLAMPIYAYMIAEGCHYTHDRMRYFLRLAGLAVVCQVVYGFVGRSLYQCILVTFSLSIGLICAVENAQKKGTSGAALAGAALFAGIYFVCEKLPQYVPGFHVDYGFWGVMLPVIVYFGGRSVWAFLAGLTVLCLSRGGLQWWAMLTVPLIALYNGQRGKHRLGWMFYLYYPAHLVVIYLIDFLL
ncbi:MAG: TraX family protein [Candidatus Faecousia sp.]|nr:TraX family protein [Candidatus Faecousia sp.]